MSNIISLDEHRPHVSGEMKCMSCDHQFVGVVPAHRDLVGVECPKCGLHRAEFDGAFTFGEGYQVLVCNTCCGDVFRISTESYLCLKCGNNFAKDNVE